MEIEGRKKRGLDVTFKENNTINFTTKKTPFLFVVKWALNELNS